jgi:hypothetical protein
VAGSDQAEAGVGDNCGTRDAGRGTRKGFHPLIPRFSSLVPRPSSLVPRHTSHVTRHTPLFLLSFLQITRETEPS